MSASRETSMSTTCCSLLFTLAVCYADVSHAQIYVPDPRFTPGEINPEVTQENIGETVCMSGWTNTIRPPGSFIAELKCQQMRARHLPGSPGEYHEDHLVPLCAGGHPSDARNLWPQPLAGQWRDADKNQLEQSVCRQLCRGDITIEQAQSWFLAPDWTKSYERYFRARQPR